jgi:hypothetical protein
MLGVMALLAQKSIIEPSMKLRQINQLRLTVAPEEAIQISGSIGISNRYQSTALLFARNLPRLRIVSFSHGEIIVDYRLRGHGMSWLEFHISEDINGVIHLSDSSLIS